MRLIGSCCGVLRAVKGGSSARHAFLPASRGHILGITALMACVAVGTFMPSAAFGWGPGIHQKLAQKYYDQPIISTLAVEFGTTVSAVVNGAGDLDAASASAKSLYHSGQWNMVGDRGYAYTSGWASNKWSQLDETTRLKYMMHNLGDVSVPIGHSPSNMVVGAPSGSTKEGILEAFADFGSYGNPSTPSGWYTGTVQEITHAVYGGQEWITSLDQIPSAGTYERDDIANALYYVNGTNETAAHEGWRISQMLGRVVLGDYYLTRRSAVTNDAVQNDIVVTTGPSIVFNASGLRDPDNITWNTDGSYYYRGDWTGISQVRWSFDGDDTYEASGTQVSRTYAQLSPYVGQDGTLTYKVAVTDDEGVTWYNTGTASIFAIPEPASGLLLILGAISLLFGWTFRRRKR